VVAVGERTITLDCPALVYRRGTRVNGVVVERVERVPANPRAVFALSPALAAGGRGDEVGGLVSIYKYRVPELRVGDWVEYDAGRVDLGGAVVTTLTAIRVARRPGGRVPRCTNEAYLALQSAFARQRAAGGGTAEDQDYIAQPYHERMQALQDWEEKRTPIPFHLHPGGPQASVAPPPRTKP
jgi:hypothetical protein